MSTVVNESKYDVVVCPTGKATVVLDSFEVLHRLKGLVFFVEYVDGGGNWNFFAQESFDGVNWFGNMRPAESWFDAQVPTIQPPRVGAVISYVPYVTSTSTPETFRPWSPFVRFVVDVPDGQAGAVVYKVYCAQDGY